MLIECDKCLARNTEACDDCVVTFVLHSGSCLDLDDEELDALAVLAEEGLVPRLRLLTEPALEQPHANPSASDRARRRA